MSSAHGTHYCCHWLKSGFELCSITKIPFLRIPRHVRAPVVIFAGGDLRRALSKSESGELQWYAKGRGLALDIAHGLHFLHSCQARLFLIHQAAPPCIHSSLHALGRYPVALTRQPYQLLSTAALSCCVLAVPVADAAKLWMVSKWCWVGQVTHRDLKTSNILLSKDQRTAKIGDVGLSRSSLTDLQSSLATVGATTPSLSKWQRAIPSINI